MQRRTQLYEGKAKVIFEGPEPGTVVAHFKDDSADLTGGKPSVVTGKGVINNAISDLIMTRLSEIGVPTHLIKRLNMREQLLHKVEIIPIEVVVRNVVAGSLAKRFGMEEGAPLARSIVDNAHSHQQQQQHQTGPLMQRYPTLMAVHQPPWIY